jgi:hypothetical protein
MKNINTFASSILATSLLCMSVLATAAPEVSNSPVLGKTSVVSILNDSAMKEVVGSGTYANAYGAYANTYYYYAYYYSYYARYSYVAGSANERYAYALAGYYGGFASAYGSFASYYSSYNY